MKHTRCSPVSLLGLLVVLASACADTIPARGPAAVGPRSAPDDDDLWNLTPAGADAVAEVDLVSFRSSRWARSLVTGGFAADREARLRRFGYDVFNEADRMLVAGVEAGAEQETLTVARGRFEPGRIGDAFTGSVAGATAGRWRESPVWEGTAEGRARGVALVTPRTVVHGEPAAVRGAIDAAWGIVPDAKRGPLGELRRTLAPGGAIPAAIATLNVTEGMRRRAAGAIEIPDHLQRVGVRLDLGDDLDADGIAVFADGDSALAAAASWREQVRVASRQRVLQLLGLTPVLRGLTLEVVGSRVQARLHIPAEQREALADKLLALLELIAGARRESR